MNQLSTTKFLEYRNGYFQGEVKTYLRSGYGMLIVDDGPILVGYFKSDLLRGRAFSFINSEEYAFLEFNRGQLQGYCTFRTAHETLVVQFSKGRPIDRQLYINYEQEKVKIMAYKNGKYDNLQSFPIQNSNESALAEKYFGLKISPPSIPDLLQKEFCSNHQNYQLKTLSNGEILFKYNEPSNLLSLGFSLARNGEQLNSYGLYLNDKLHGMGCRFERNVKYEGIFENGLLHGLGLRLSNNRYSFGMFQKGNLVEAIHLQERSNNSLEKLRELKKKDHIKSFNFFNGFIPKKIIRFKGIVQIAIGSSTVKQTVFSQSPQHQQIGQQPHSSNLKGSNVSLNQILSGSRVQQNQFQVSSRPSIYTSQVTKRKNEEEREWFEGMPVNRNLFQTGKFNE